MSDCTSFSSDELLVEQSVFPRMQVGDSALDLIGQALGQTQIRIFENLAISY